MMRSRLILIAAIAGGVLTFSSTISAQKMVPYGSYRETCQNVSVSGSTMTALCKPKSGSLLTTPVTSLSDFFMCAGDIANNDSKLTCSMSDNHPKLNKMVDTMKASFAKIIGQDLAEDPIMWVRLYFKLRDNATYHFYKTGFTPEVSDGFILEVVKQPNRNDLRTAIINNAFEDVYGKLPSAADFSFWMGELTKKGGSYPEIVAVESNKMNANKITRRFMITAAYKKALGRPALGAELDLWTPKAAIFKNIVANRRSFLYGTSNESSAELIATIKRFWMSKHGGEPSATQLANAITKYTKLKAIYSEMK